MQGGGIVIDGAAVQLVIPWAAGIGFLVWIFIEWLKDYRGIKAKIKTLAETKLDEKECTRRMGEELEGRKREREAVKADRELRGGL